MICYVNENEEKEGEIIEEDEDKEKDDIIIEKDERKYDVKDLIFFSHFTYINGNK